MILVGTNRQIETQTDSWKDKESDEIRQSGKGIDIQTEKYR